MTATAQMNIRIPLDLKAQLDARMAAIEAERPWPRVTLAQLVCSILSDALTPATKPAKAAKGKAARKAVRK